MVTYCWIAFEHYDAGDKTGFQKMMDEMPESARWQLEVAWFDDVQKACAHRIVADSSCRPTVNDCQDIDWSFELQRCLRQSPDGQGADYFASGGNPIEYGACCLANCPIGRKQERATVVAS